MVARTSEIQYRVLLFCHDSKGGLGHLQRICRIAAKLQSEGDFACLIVTGMKDAHWLVPNACELVKLPSWNGLSAARSRHHAVPQWLRLSRERAAEFRAGLLQAVGGAFKPDAILVDYLPLGLAAELRPLLEATAARKYLIHRGIADRADRDVLWGEATRIIAGLYDRILVTADDRVADVAQESGFVAAAASKVCYLGYLRPDAGPAGRTRRVGKPLIICSCGSGLHGAPVFTACLRAARALPEYEFRIVLGPHGALEPQVAAAGIPPNCRVRRVHRNLAAWHRSATVVLTHGGYNSTLEAISGGARILISHVQGGELDERLRFEQRLSPYYPVRAVPSLEHLSDELRIEVGRAEAEGRPRFGLDFDGFEAIARLLRADLSARRERG